MKLEKTKLSCLATMFLLLWYVVFFYFIICICEQEYAKKMGAPFIHGPTAQHERMKIIQERVEKCSSNRLACFAA